MAWGDLWPGEAGGMAVWMRCAVSALAVLRWRVAPVQVTWTDCDMDMFLGAKGAPSNCSLCETMFSEIVLNPTVQSH